MTADQLNFGVEVETFVPNDVPFSIYHYHSTSRLHVRNLPVEVQESYRPLEDWSPQNDGSIMPRSGHRPCEFVSPILTGREGLRKLYAAVTCMKTVVRAKVNASCGVHIHVGFPRDPNALKRLVHLVASHEQALYAASGTPRREQGRWCAGIKHDLTPDIQFSMGRSFTGNGISCNQGAAQERYKIINLQGMLGGGRNTVEFRLFSESNNPNKIIAWVRLCLALVEKAINGKRAAKWFHNDKAVVEKGGKGGDGFKALKLLTYKIGWIRGRSFDWVGGQRVHRTWGGDLDNIDGLPSLKASKAVLKKLARKYDEKLAEMRATGRV